MAAVHLRPVPLREDPVLAALVVDCAEVGQHFVSVLAVVELLDHFLS